MEFRCPRTLLRKYTCCWLCKRTKGVSWCSLVSPPAKVEKGAGVPMSANFRMYSPSKQLLLPQALYTNTLLRKCTCCWLCTRTKCVSWCSLVSPPTKIERGAGVLMSANFRMYSPSKQLLLPQALYTNTVMPSLIGSKEALARECVYK
jgi:hypothetical protein